MLLASLCWNAEVDDGVCSCLLAVELESAFRMVNTASISTKSNIGLNQVNKITLK
jgi:hypothetical protein